MRPQTWPSHKLIYGEKSGRNNHPARRHDCYEALDKLSDEELCSKAQQGCASSRKTFLGVIVARAFSKYCRQWRRYHNRVVLDPDGEATQSITVEADELWRTALYPRDRNGCSSEGWKGLLFAGLSSDRLAEVLRKLKPQESHLLEIWLHFGRDKKVAEVLGISVSAAKLRRERLFRRIKQSATAA
jgi:DNA-directed RNA polymerase specialized sigma24 family protein